MLEQEFATPGDVLKHHGVKGMKWGVTKEKVSGAAARVAGARDSVSKGHETARRNAAGNYRKAAEISRTRASIAGSKRAARAHMNDAAKFDRIASRKEQAANNQKTSREFRNSPEGKVARAEAIKGVPKKALKGIVTGVKDANFETNANSQRTVSLLVNGASTKMKEKDLPAINAKHQATAKTSNNPTLVNLSPLKAQRAYKNDVKAAYLKRLHETAGEMTNASGTRQYSIDAHSPTVWTVHTTSVKHAGAVTELPDIFDVKLILDKNGFVTDIVPVPEPMQHGEAFVSNFLEHSGTDVL